MVCNSSGRTCRKDLVEETLEKSVELRMAVDTPPNEPKQLRQKKYSAVQSNPGEAPGERQQGVKAI